MQRINICILGAGGQLGSKLIGKLKDNNAFSIYAVDKTFKSKNLKNNIKYFSTDLNENFENTFQQIPQNETVFINCVGLQHSIFSKKIMDVNFKLNKKLYEYISNNFLNFHYIFISSLSVDFKNPHKIIPGKGNPINMYGKSKLRFEKYLYENINQKSNISIIRPAAFDDMNLSQNLINFFDLLINKIFFLPTKQIKRSFLSLEYFSSFMENYIISGKKKDVFEVGDAEPIEFNSLIDSLKTSNIKVNSKIFNIPTLIFKFAGFVGYSLEKIGIHISLLTILGEFGYDYITVENDLYTDNSKEDTYKNFENIIKENFNLESE
jgi:nucleoside-diphosphate-sugar epimerase